METISCNNLSIGYAEKVIQTGLSFSLNAGEVVCLLGRNGCGKSTLLRTLAGLLPVLDGTYKIGTTDAKDAQSAIALVLTERLSLENTTVHDVVAMGRYPYTSFMGGLSPKDEQIILDALKDVGLEDIIYTPFNAHSDGEKQRVLIAKALAQATPLILLDEPTAHLDLPNRIHILKLLKRLANEQQKTILISTHELDLACQFSDRVLLMRKDGIELDTAELLRGREAFTTAFGMDVFHPLD